MAKNYAALYANDNDSTALEQSFYLKEEVTRGTLIAPLGTDYLYTIAGGGIEFTQPLESSPHRSGRHNNSTIKAKKTLSWTLPLFFNIDTALGAASSAEIDPAVRLLYKSTLGFQDLTAGAVYNASTEPSVTFSIFECGDRWGRQARGCFVDEAALSFPGDGRSQVEFSGMGSEAVVVGIGKSVTANTGNTVTVAAGEGYRFPVNGLVMILKADGVTRSTDTATPRTVLSVAGDVVTLSGAPLVDADGTTTPVYLSYWEPATKTGIDNPLTGLIGSVEIAGLTEQCVRSCNITIANGHELEDYCFGKDAAHGKIFIPANRMNATVSLELNLNHDLVEFFNSIQQFEAKDITLVLGSPTGRRLEILLPNVIFPVPSIPVPETGSIPITFEGVAYQTVLDAADEITLSFI